MELYLTEKFAERSAEGVVASFLKKVASGAWPLATGLASRSLDRFEQSSSALTATDAHGHNTVLLLAASQLAQNGTRGA